MTQYHDDNPFLLLRVLVSGHSVSINESLTALLLDLEGVRVYGCAQESDKVMALIQTVHPDVVILDLQENGILNFSLLRQIKEFNPPPDVIVLSGYDILPLKEASMAAGSDYFIRTTECATIPEVIQDLQRKKARF